MQSLRRLMEYCDCDLCVFTVVYEDGGKMVPGLANRNGHHNHAADRYIKGWRNLHIKNVLIEEVN